MLVPTPKNCDISVKKSIQLLSTKLDYDASPTFYGLTLSSLTASTLIGANADKLLESVTIGTGLDYIRPTLSLRHLGIEGLTDPLTADKIFFWDNSAGASKWLGMGDSIAITTTTIDTIQDIQTTASPEFAGLTIGDAGNVVLGTITGTKIGTATSQKLGFFNVTPVVQQTALTSTLTDLTYTAPGTPNYAIQDLTQTTPYGFVTKDEGNTVLKSIQANKVRIDELEDKLQMLGLIA